MSRRGGQPIQQSTWCGSDDTGNASARTIPRERLTPAYGHACAFDKCLCYEMSGTNLVVSVHKTLQLPRWSSCRPHRHPITHTKRVSISQQQHLLEQPAALSRWQQRRACLAVGSQPQQVEVQPQRYRQPHDTVYYSHGAHSRDQLQLDKQWRRCEALAVCHNQQLRSTELKN